VICQAAGTAPFWQPLFAKFVLQVFGSYWGLQVPHLDHCLKHLLHLCAAVSDSRGVCCSSVLILQDALGDPCTSPVFCAMLDTVHLSAFEWRCDPLPCWVLNRSSVQATLARQHIKSTCNNRRSRLH
jgi:hypothetical protein